MQSCSSPRVPRDLSYTLSLQRGDVKYENEGCFRLLATFPTKEACHMDSHHVEGTMEIPVVSYNTNHLPQEPSIKYRRIRQGSAFILLANMLPSSPVPVLAFQLIPRAAECVF